MVELLGIDNSVARRYTAVPVGGGLVVDLAQEGTIVKPNQAATVNDDDR